MDFEVARFLLEGIMNKLITSALAAAALASLSSAYAAPAVGSDDSAAAQRIQVTGPSTYKLAPHEFDDFAYAYGLETGQTLKLRQQVNRYFTQLKGQPEVEIFLASHPAPLSPGRAPRSHSVTMDTRLS
ncbi:hypothetical protein ACFS07_21610 [Undibacterium arcticum]